MNFLSLETKEKLLKLDLVCRQTCITSPHLNLYFAVIKAEKGKGVKYYQDILDGKYKDLDISRYANGCDLLYSNHLYHLRVSPCENNGDVIYTLKSLKGPQILFVGYSNDVDFDDVDLELLVNENNLILENI